MRAPTGTLLRVCLVVGVLAACSDPDQPSTVPSDRPTTSSSTASQSPATPEEEVEAAVRAYYAELTRAAQTNDTRVLATMSTTGCPCYRAVEVIKRNAREGESTPDASFVLTSVRVHDIEGGTALAEVKTRDAAYDVLDRSNRVVDRVAAQTTHIDISLVRGPSSKWIFGNTFNLEAS